MVSTNTITRTRSQSLLTQLIKDESEAFAPLKQGDVIEGAMIEKGSRRMLIDLGKHGTGAVYRGELMNARELTRGLKPNDIITGKVIEIDNEEGFVELSLTEAGLQKSWDTVIELQGKEEVFKAKASGFNKGGLIIELAGLKAFLPLSQLSSEHYPRVTDGDTQKIVEELQNLQAETFTLKVIDVNQKQDKVILSERDALQEESKELVNNYSIGQEVEGIISGVVDFGAFFKFADNPSLEGIIQTPELSHTTISNPKEFVKINDSIKAKIIEIKDGKIYLSIKALTGDPWQEVASLYKKGQEVKGTVYNFTPVGAVITLGSVQGQVHITEFGGIEEMKKQLKEGEEHSFIIKEIKPEEKRIHLSPKPSK
jgi:small subunit ribosomal protein S1